jgi:hypothetical protein
MGNHEGQRGEGEGELGIYPTSSFGKKKLFTYFLNSPKASYKINTRERWKCNIYKQQRDPKQHNKNNNSIIAVMRNFME